MVHHRGTNDQAVNEKTHAFNMVIGSNGQAELNHKVSYITSTPAHKNYDSNNGNGSMISNAGKNGSKTIQTHG